MEYHFGIMRDMTLHEYLAANSIAEAAFAARLGVSQVTVHRYVKGDRFPDKQTILKIEELTDKAVKPADWYAERAA